MSGRVIMKEMQGTAKPSRQINVILRNQESNSMGQSASESQTTDKELPHRRKFSEVLKDLDPMIGLDNVKELVYEIYALIHVSQLRSEAGLQGNSHVYHMIFKGNPGTGKTTVARIVAGLFHSMGVLQKGHLIEVERADLVGEYIGHTAIKTRDLVKKALGGILFIDEAYSLARGGEKDFGKEAIDCLVKSMEDYKNQFVLILAGYSEEMEVFLQSNPGLPSRFPIQVDFSDYSVDQLIQIAEWMIKEREYCFLPQTTLKLRQHLMHEKNNSMYAFSNARFVRNLIEKAIRFQAVRLLNFYHSPSKHDLMVIRPEDLRLDKSSL